MKFMPYRLVDGKVSVVSFQLGGKPEVAVADVATLSKRLAPGTHLLLHFPWHEMYNVGHWLAQLQKRINGRCFLHLMCNTPGEVAGFLESGLPVLHAPASLYVSEHLFRIRTEVPKRYDAIYISNFRPGHWHEVKRQYLARNVKNLRIITYPVRREVSNGLFDHEFYKTFPELSHAVVNNAYLGQEEVAYELNAAQVHLALSDVEGCMYAFTEGFLCGVPAVSTRGMGGREHFFHPKYVELVDPDPDKILAAVHDVAGRTYDRTSIREFALDRIRQFRAHYLKYVARLSGLSCETLEARIFGDHRGADRLRFHFDRATEEEVRAEHRRQAASD